MSPIIRPQAPKKVAPVNAARPAPAASAPNTVAAPQRKGFDLRDHFASKLPEPFRRGEGPKIDQFNAAKDWMSDRLFAKGAPKGPPEKLTGAQRVAYGPVNAAPTLKRPVVMIPGLTMPAASFGKATDGLAKNKANGPVAVYVASEDKFRLGGKGGRELSANELRGVKIFQVEYKDPWASPTKKAPQIDRAMQRIAGATGGGPVDVVTHSAGGTDFRLYLQNRDPKKGPEVNRAVMVGPASHGTQIGNIGAVVGAPVKNVDDAARELAVGSKMIEGLNATWDHQRGQVKNGITIIGTTGTPTLGPKPGMFEDGDGYMPTAQLAMPGAKTVLMEGPHNTPLAHLWQVQYSGVVNATYDALRE
jgi:pimeloyl-ACP methyl ester carboxylesterase